MIQPYPLSRMLQSARDTDTCNMARKISAINKYGVCRNHEINSKDLLKLYI